MVQFTLKFENSCYLHFLWKYNKMSDVNVQTWCILLGNCTSVLAETMPFVKVFVLYMICKEWFVIQISLNVLLDYQCY